MTKKIPGVETVYPGTKSSVLSSFSGFSASCLKSEAYNLIPGDSWIEKIKFAFDEADTNHKKKLTMEQWMDSRLRYVISSEALDNNRLQEYFHQIDYDADDVITWKGLLTFLTFQQQGNASCSQFGTPNLRLIHIAPDDQAIALFHKSSQCIGIVYYPSNSVIVSVHDNSINIWSMDKNILLKKLTEPDGHIVAFCFLESFSTLVIAKSTRELLFYDLMSESKMNLSFSGSSIDSQTISQLSLIESKEIMKKLHQKILYHAPTSLACYPDKSYFFVGNEVGQVEAYIIQQTNMEWEIHFLQSFHKHRRTINDMKWIASLNSFVSASDDGLILLWVFDIQKHFFSVTKVFKQTDNYPIRKFDYDERTHDIVYLTPYHKLGIWRPFSHHLHYIETPNQIVSTFSIIPINEELSFLLTISDHNLITIFSMPNGELLQSYYLNRYHKLIPPTASIVVNSFLILCGSYVSTWHCESDQTDGLRPHSSPIVSVIAHESFNQIISVDESGTLINWDVNTGKKTLTFRHQFPGAIATCAELDNQKRRIAVGYTSGLILLLAINSGEILTKIDPVHNKGGCNGIKFLKTRSVISMNGRKELVQFDDFGGNVIRFSRMYSGHTEQISSMTPLKNNYIVSIGIGKEIFLWSTKLKGPILSFNSEEIPIFAHDIPNHEKNFILGDKKGQIILYSIESPNPLKIYDPFSMSIPSGITFIEQINETKYLVSNYHGYIKILSIDITKKNECKISDIYMFRVSLEPVECITFFSNFNIMVCFARDQEIRVWSFEPRGIFFIGELGKQKKWNINSLETWRRDNPYEIESVHFEKNDVETGEQTQISSLEISSDSDSYNSSDDDLNYQTSNDQPFSFSHLREMLDNLDTLYQNGKDSSKKVRKIVETSEKSLSNHISTPTFDSLFTNHSLEATSETINKLRREKINSSELSKKKKQKKSDIF